MTLEDKPVLRDEQGIRYYIVKAIQVGRGVGRPRNRQARVELTLRRLRGKKLLRSWMYYDGSFCKPFYI